MLWYLLLYFTHCEWTLLCMSVTAVFYITDIFILYFIYNLFCIVTVAERLRRWTGNPKEFLLTGLNPVYYKNSLRVYVCEDSRFIYGGT